MSVEVDSDSQFSKEAWRKKLRPLRTKVDSATEIIVINHLAKLLDQVDGPILFYRAMAEEDFEALMKDNRGVIADLKGLLRGQIQRLNYWSL